MAAPPATKLSTRGGGSAAELMMTSAVSFDVEEDHDKKNGIGIGIDTMEGLENRLGQIDNEEEHMVNFKKIVGAQKQTLDDLVSSLEYDRTHHRTRHDMRKELLKQYGQENLEENMSPQIITDPDDPVWRPKMSKWQKSDIIVQRQAQKKQDPSQYDTIGRARFLAVLNAAKDEMTRAYSGTGAPGQSTRPKGQATVRELLTESRAAQTVESTQEVMAIVEREMDPTRRLVDSEGIMMDRKVVIPRDSVQRAAAIARSEQQAASGFDLGAKDLDKVAQRAMKAPTRAKGKRMIKKAPPPPPPDDPNNPDDVNPAYGRVITNVDGTTTIMKVKHERLSGYRLSRVDERIQQARNQLYTTHILRAMTRGYARLEDLTSLLMRRMLGSKLPASAGAGDGLDVLGDCQGSADWEDDGRDEARIVAALNRIQRSTKLREAPRCIGVVPTFKPYHREEASFLKEGRTAREKERTQARVTDWRKSRGMDSPSTSEDDNSVAESDAAEFETQLETRITNIRGCIVGARNLYKDIVVADGISMAPPVGDPHREVPVPLGMTQQRAEKLARSAESRSRRMTGSFLPSFNGRAGKTGMDPFEYITNPNPYVVMRGIDYDTTIFELCRTEPLLETKAPCWDLDFNVNVPEQLSKLRGIEFHVYDYQDWAVSSFPLGLMPWDKGDYSLGKWVVDLHAMNHALSQSDAELIAMKHMNEHKGRLIYQAAVVRRKIHCLKRKLHIQTEYEFLRQRVTGLYGIQNLYSHCFPGKQLPRSITEYGFVEPATREAVEDTILECHGEKSKRRQLKKDDEDENLRPPPMEINLDIEPPPGAPKRHPAVIRLMQKQAAEAERQKIIQMEQLRQMEERMQKLQEEEEERARLRRLQLETIEEEEYTVKEETDTLTMTMTQGTFKEEEEEDTLTLTATTLKRDATGEPDHNTTISTFGGRSTDRDGKAAFAKVARSKSKGVEMAGTNGSANGNNGGDANGAANIEGTHQMADEGTSKPAEVIGSDTGAARGSAPTDAATAQPASRPPPRQTNIVPPGASSPAHSSPTNSSVATPRRKKKKNKKKKEKKRGGLFGGGAQEEPEDPTLELAEALELNSLVDKIKKERKEMRRRIKGDTTLPAFTVVVFGVFSNGEERELHRYPLVTSYNSFGLCPVDMLVGDSTLLGPNGASSNKIKYALRLPTTRPPPSEIEMDLVATLNEIRAKRNPNSPANRLFADQLNRCQPVVGVKGWEPLASGMKNVTQGRAIGASYGFTPLAESFVISAPGLKGSDAAAHQKKVEEARKKMLEANFTKMDKVKSTDKNKRDPRLEAMSLLDDLKKDGGEGNSPGAKEKDARRQKRAKHKMLANPGGSAASAGGGSPSGRSSTGASSTSDGLSPRTDESDESAEEDDEDYKTMLFSDNTLARKVEKALSAVDKELHPFVLPRWTYDFARDNPFARQNSTLLAERTYARKNQMGEGMVEELLNETTVDLLYLRFRVFEPSPQLRSFEKKVEKATRRRRKRRRRELNEWPLFVDKMPYDLQSRAVENKSMFLHARGGHKRAEGLFAKEEMNALIAERKRLQEEADARDWKAQLRMNQAKSKQNALTSRLAGKWTKKAEEAGGLMAKRKQLQEEEEEESSSEDQAEVEKPKSETDDSDMDALIAAGSVGKQSKEVRKMLKKAEQERAKAAGLKRKELSTPERKKKEARGATTEDEEAEELLRNQKLMRQLQMASPKREMESPILSMDAQMAMDVADFSSSSAASDNNEAEADHNMEGQHSAPFASSAGVTKSASKAAADKASKSKAPVFGGLKKGKFGLANKLAKKIKMKIFSGAASSGGDNKETTSTSSSSSLRPGEVAQEIPEAGLRVIYSEEALRRFPGLRLDIRPKSRTAAEEQESTPAAAPQSCNQQESARSCPSDDAPLVNKDLAAEDEQMPDMSCDIESSSVGTAVPNDFLNEVLGDLMSEASSRSPLKDNEEEEIILLHSEKKRPAIWTRQADGFRPRQIIEDPRDGSQMEYGDEQANFALPLKIDPQEAPRGGSASRSSLIFGSADGTPPPPQKSSTTRKPPLFSPGPSPRDLLPSIPEHETRFQEDAAPVTPTLVPSEVSSDEEKAVDQLHTNLQRSATGAACPSSSRRSKSKIYVEGRHAMDAGAEEPSAEGDGDAPAATAKSKIDEKYPLPPTGPPPLVQDPDLIMGGREDKRLINAGRSLALDEYERDEDVFHDPFPAGSMVRVPHDPQFQPDRHLPDALLKQRKLLMPQISEDTAEKERQQLLEWQRQRYAYRTKTGTRVDLQIPREFSTEGFAAEDWKRKSLRIYGPPEGDNDRDGDKWFRDQIVQDEEERSKQLNSVWQAYHPTDTSDEDADVMDEFRFGSVGQLLAEGVYFLNCASLHALETVQVDLFPAHAVADKLAKDATAALGGVTVDAQKNSSGPPPNSLLSKKKRVALARNRSIVFGGQKPVSKITLKQRIKNVIKFPIEYGREGRERDANLAKARTRKEMAQVEQVFGASLPGESALRAFKDKMAKKRKSFYGRSGTDQKKREFFPVRWQMASMKGTRMMLYFQLEVTGRRYLLRDDIERYVRSRDFKKKVEQTNRLRRMKKLKESGPQAPKDENEDEETRKAREAEEEEEARKAAEGQMGGADGEELEPEEEYRPSTEVKHIYGLIVKCGNVQTDARGLMDPADVEEWYNSQKANLVTKERKPGKFYDGKKIDLEIAQKMAQRRKLWTGVGDSLFRKNRSIFARKRTSTTISVTGVEQVREYPMPPPITRKLQTAHLYVVVTALDEQNRPWKKSVITRINPSCSANGLGQMPTFNSDFLFSFGGTEDRGEFGLPEKLEFSLYQRADLRLTPEELEAEHQRKMQEGEFERSDFLLEGAGDSTEIGEGSQLLAAGEDGEALPTSTSRVEVMTEGVHSSPRNAAKLRPGSQDSGSDVKSVRSGASSAAAATRAGPRNKSIQDHVKSVASSMLKTRSRSSADVHKAGNKSKVLSASIQQQQRDEATAMAGGSLDLGPRQTNHRVKNDKHLKEHRILGVRRRKARPRDSEKFWGSKYGSRLLTKVGSLSKSMANFGGAGEPLEEGVPQFLQNDNDHSTVLGGSLYSRSRTVNYGMGIVPSTEASRDHYQGDLLLHGGDSSIYSQDLSRVIEQEASRTLSSSAGGGGSPSQAASEEAVPLWVAREQEALGGRPREQIGGSSSSTGGRVREDKTGKRNSWYFPSSPQPHAGAAHQNGKDKYMSPPGIKPKSSSPPVGKKTKSPAKAGELSPRSKLVASHSLDEGLNPVTLEHSREMGVVAERSQELDERTEKTWRSWQRRVERTKADAKYIVDEDELADDEMRQLEALMTNDERSLTDGGGTLGAGERTNSNSFVPGDTNSTWRAGSQRTRSSVYDPPGLPPEGGDSEMGSSIGETDHGSSAFGGSRAGSRRGAEGPAEPSLTRTFGGDTLTNNDPSLIMPSSYHATDHGTTSRDAVTFEEDELQPASKSYIDDNDTLNSVSLLREQLREKKALDGGAEAAAAPARGLWGAIRDLTRGLHFRRKASAKDPLVTMSSKKRADVRADQRENNARFDEKVADALVAGTLRTDPSLNLGLTSRQSTPAGIQMMRNTGSSGGFGASSTAGFGATSSSAGFSASNRASGNLSRAVGVDRNVNYAMPPPVMSRKASLASSATAIIHSPPKLKDPWNRKRNHLRKKRQAGGVGLQIEGNHFAADPASSSAVESEGDFSKSERRVRFADQVDSVSVATSDFDVPPMRRLSASAVSSKNSYNRRTTAERTVSYFHRPNQFYDRPGKRRKNKVVTPEEGEGPAATKSSLKRRKPDVGPKNFDEDAAARNFDTEQELAAQQRVSPKKLRMLTEGRHWSPEKRRRKAVDILSEGEHQSPVKYEEKIQAPKGMGGGGSRSVGNKQDSRSGGGMKEANLTSPVNAKAQQQARKEKKKGKAETAIKGLGGPSDDLKKLMEDGSDEEEEEEDSDEGMDARERRKLIRQLEKQEKARKLKRMFEDEDSDEDASVIMEPEDLLLATGQLQLSSVRAPGSYCEVMLQIDKRRKKALLEFLSMRNPDKADQDYYPAIVPTLTVIVFVQPGLFFPRFAELENFELLNAGAESDDGQDNAAPKKDGDPGDKKDPEDNNKKDGDAGQLEDEPSPGKKVLTEAPPRNTISRPDLYQIENPDRPIDMDSDDETIPKIISLPDPGQVAVPIHPHPESVDKTVSMIKNRSLRDTEPQHRFSAHNDEWRQMPDNERIGWVRQGFIERTPNWRSVVHEPSSMSYADPLNAPTQLQEFVGLCEFEADYKRNSKQCLKNLAQTGELQLADTLHEIRDQDYLARLHAAREEFVVGLMEKDREQRERAAEEERKRLAAQMGVLGASAASGFGAKKGGKKKDAPTALPGKEPSTQSKERSTSTQEKSSTLVDSKEGSSHIYQATEESQVVSGQLMQGAPGTNQTLQLGPDGRAPTDRQRVLGKAKLPWVDKKIAKVVEEENIFPSFGAVYGTGRYARNDDADVLDTRRRWVQIENPHSTQIKALRNMKKGLPDDHYGHHHGHHH